MLIFYWDSTARTVRPECTKPIPNPDVSSDTRAVCPYIGIHKTFLKHFP